MYILLDSVFLIFILRIEFFSVRCVRGTAFFFMLFVRAIFFYMGIVSMCVWGYRWLCFVPSKLL